MEIIFETEVKTGRDKISEYTYYESEALLHVTMLKGANVDLDNLIEHFDTILKLTDNKKYVALIDTANYFKIQPEAFMHSSLESATINRIATAFYKPHIANKVSINFFKRYFQPTLPFEMFDSMEEALAWLECLKLEQMRLSD